MATFDMALVDEIRRRLDASYEEAQYGLEQAEGELLAALTAIEKHRRERQETVDGGEIIGRAVGLARSGQLGELELKLGDRLLRKVPLPKSQAGTILGAVVAALLSQIKLEVVTRTPEVETSTVETEVAEEAG